MTPRPTRRIRLACTLLGVALLASTATLAEAQNSRAAQLLSDRPAPRRGCRISQAPLPSVSQLADSARLAQVAAQFAADYPVREGKLRGLYSISFGNRGQVERVSDVDYWLPEGQAEAFRQIVRATLLPQQSGPFSVRLLVEPSAEPVIRVGRSEVCPPESNMRFSLTAPALAGVEGPQQPVRLKMFIGEDGRMASISVVSSSGNSELDRWVESVVLQYRFAPGLVDGTPVAMEHEQSIRIRPPR